MATILRDEIEAALSELGRLAELRAEQIELVLVGGALMVLEFNSRESTRDVDAIIISPKPELVRELAGLVAVERGWPPDWLNDGAKGFMVGITDGPVVFAAPGIHVRRPDWAQMLAMKLCAWRDDVDIADGRRILQEIQGDREGIWCSLKAYLFPGSELKAQYAFEDLWEDLYGES